MITAAVAPSLLVDGWIAWVLTIGGLSTAVVALATLVRKVLLPAASIVAQVQRDYPVWTGIAEKFVSTEGQETLSLKLEALAANDELAAANQRTMMAQLETVIAQARLTDEKLSDTRHKVIGEFAVLRAADGATRTLVEAIKSTSDELVATRADLVKVNEELATLRKHSEES